MSEQDRIERLIVDNSGGNSDREANLERRIKMLIEEKHRQICRIRIAVAVAWAVLAAVFVAGGITEAIAGHGLISNTFAAVTMGALLIALFLSGSWYVRSVSLRFDSIQQALAAIQDRLNQGSVLDPKEQAR